MRLSELLPQCVADMVNLSTDDTGIESGYVVISTKYEQHGCRIKYYPNIKYQSRSFVVSIPDFVIVEDNTGKKVSDRIKKEVVVFAILNQEKIQHFWNNGHTMTRSEVAQLLDSLTKITKDDYKKISKLKFKY